MKGNATILASILAIILVATGVGAGTMAWFSTPQVSTGYATMKSATMSMANPVAITSWDFNNLKPGDEFRITTELSNTGTMDIPYLAVDWRIGGIDYTQWTNNPTIMEFASQIEVTHIWERVNGDWRDSMADPQNYWAAVGDKVKPLTLLELAQSYWGGEPTWTSVRKQDQFGGWVGTTTDAVTGMEYDITPGPALPLGTYYQMALDLKFSTTAGNNLQGKTLQFYVLFTGYQDISALP